MRATISDQPNPLTVSDQFETDYIHTRLAFD